MKAVDLRNLRRVAVDQLRIPDEADQRSGMMSITIPS
jgi:hypothetical protein